MTSQHTDNASPDEQPNESGTWDESGANSYDEHEASGATWGDPPSTWGAPVHTWGMDQLPANKSTKK